MFCSFCYANFAHIFLDVVLSHLMFSDAIANVVFKISISNCLLILLEIELIFDF